MKKTSVKRLGEFYRVDFPDYEALLTYLSQKKPSQVCISYDGEHLTAGVPVSAYTVRIKDEEPES